MRTPLAGELGAGLVRSKSPRIEWDRGFIKILADADTGRIVGITAFAGVSILEAAMTVQQVAGMWSPYLTMAEDIKIAAQSFATDVSKLSCCTA